MRFTLAWWPFAGCLVLWLAAFLASGSVRGGPSGRGMAGDLAVFLGAAQARGAATLYQPALVLRREDTLLRRQGIAAPPGAQFIRVGNPPAVFALLRPLGDLPFRWVAWAWLAISEAVLAASLIWFTGAVGVSRKPAVLGACLCAPVGVLSVYYGNFDPLIVASLVAAMLLAERHPVSAGAIGALGWLKPQIALPMILLVMLFAPLHRGRMAGGFAAGTATVLLLSILAEGPIALGAWVHALAGYGGRLNVQPDIASLSGLFAYSLPARSRIAAQCVLILVALVLTMRAAGTTRDRGLAALAQTGWLWIVWFLATPFAHFHDEVVLFLPVIVWAAQSPGRPQLTAVRFALYCALLSVLLFPVARFSLDPQSLGLLPLLVVMKRSGPCASESNSVRPTLQVVA